MKIFEMRIYQNDKGAEIIERVDTKTGDKFYASIGVLDRPVMSPDGKMETQSQQIEFDIIAGSVERAFRDREKWFDKAVEQINKQTPKILTPPNVAGN